MSELVSSVELKKANGKPITFNFQFENGLPVKPLILAKKADFWYVADGNYYGVSIFLESKDALIIKNFTPKLSSYHPTNDLDKETIWIHLDNEYIVINNITKETTKKLKSHNLEVVFYNQDNKIIS